MGQLVVRNIGESVKAKLKRRAQRNGRSMEAEARDILRNAVVEDADSAGGLGTELHSLFREVGLDGPIPELRGHRVRPPRFR